MNEELRLEIERQMEKLNQKRDNATSIEELKNIDWKVNMCLFRLGKIDYNVKIGKFKKIK